MQLSFNDLANVTRSDLASSVALGLMANNEEKMLIVTQHLFFEPFTTPRLIHSPHTDALNCAELHRYALIRAGARC